MPRIATFTAHATDNTAEAVIEVHETPLPKGGSTFVVKVPAIGSMDAYDTAMDTLRDAMIHAACMVTVALN